MGKVIGTNKFHCGEKVMKNIFLKLLSGMGRADWNSIYSSTDAWEAELVRSAMINEGVSATVKSNEYVVDAAGKKRRS